MKSNRIKSICVIFVIVFSAFACTRGLEQEHLRVFENFPEVIDLHGTPVMTGDEKYNPLLMGLKDNLLVVCDVENGPHFHVYALPEFEYLGNFGQQGRGPSEFQSPFFWGQFEKGERVKIWVYDPNNVTLSLIDVLDALNDERFKTDTCFVLPNEAYEAINVMKIGGNNLTGNGAFFNGEFFKYDTETDKIQWIAKNTNYNKGFRQLLETSNDFGQLTLKQGFAKIKPDQSRYAKALVYAPIIDVYKPDGVLEFSIILNDFEIPNFNEEEFSLKTRGWYGNIFLTDSFIYAINRNCTLEQYSLNECDDAEIHVFNWKGEPVVLFRLNEGIAPSAAFVVDEENKKIYTVNPRDEKHLFSVFDFSQHSFIANVSDKSASNLM